MAEAARVAQVDEGLSLCVQQVVTDVPDADDMTWVVELGGGKVRVTAGRAETPDLTFTQDHATAVAIHRGELSAQAAFVAGRLRVEGDVQAAAAQAGALAALDDIFGGVRA